MISEKVKRIRKERKDLEKELKELRSSLRCSECPHDTVCRQKKYCVTLANELKSRFALTNKQVIHLAAI